MQADNYFPWDETKEDGTVPTGTYQVVVNAAEDTVSKSGKRMVKVSFMVKAPAEYAGSFLTDYNVLGSDEAPTSILPGSRGTKDLKRTANAAQIPMTNDINMLLAQLKGSELVLDVVNYVEESGDFAGRESNKITRRMKVGEAVPRVEIGKKPGQTGQTQTVPMIPRRPLVPNKTVEEVGKVEAAPTAPTQPEPKIMCTICNSMIPRSQYSSHMQAHAPD